MKKILALLMVCTMFFIGGCNKSTLSNLDIQKLNQKAATYMQNGEYDKAAARLEAIIDLNPNFYEPYYNLGIAYYNMTEYEKSLNAFNEAIKRKEDLADAYYSRAVLYDDWANSLTEDKEGKEVKAVDKETAKQYLENAKSDYEKYLELNPKANDKDEVDRKLAEIDEALNGNPKE